MKSVMQHDFSMTPAADISRSTFDRSHGYKTCFDAGQLIPMYVDEVYPGDTFNLRTACFARMATPIYPIMDNLFMETFYFFVPNRLVWDNWAKFMGEQESPGDSTAFLIPQQTSPTGGYPEGSLEDYLGIPTLVEGLSHSALIIRAYNLVVNEWFRDQNLVPPIDWSNGDGPDVPPAQGNSIAIRGKRFDYFTQALPFPQKGPDVQLPLGTSAPLIPLGANGEWFIGGGTSPLEYDLGGTSSSQDTIYTTAVDPTDAGRAMDLNAVADLALASSATINEWRQAIAIQRLYERDARGGTRYPEIIMSHFRVRDPMYAVLQRPQYLGGGSQPININPVQQTGDFTSVGGEGTTGTLGAFGTVSFNGHGFNHSFTEHGTIIGLVNVRADITYQQGLNRFWSRLDRFDFYFPELAPLGEQAVLNKEIYAQGTAEDDDVFGYVPRFDELRHKPSLITGAFRSNAASGTLDAWHLSQNFENLPTLNALFIADLPPVDRVIATPDEPHFIADFYHKLICSRPLPMYGVPGLDHF